MHSRLAAGAALVGSQASPPPIPVAFFNASFSMQRPAVPCSRTGYEFMPRKAAAARRTSGPQSCRIRSPCETDKTTGGQKGLQMPSPGRDRRCPAREDVSVLLVPLISLGWSCSPSRTDEAQWLRCGAVCQEVLGLNFGFAAISLGSFRPGGPCLNFPLLQNGPKKKKYRAG